MVEITVEITSQSLYKYLLYNDPIRYNEYITLYPVKMKDILCFQQYKSSITLRKDAIFRKKNIIKMSYLEFLKYACRNESLSEEYSLPLLPYYYDFAINLLQIVCGDDAEIKYNTENLSILINNFIVTDEIFDDLRKIIIIQNDIDFDIDEFMNIETVNAFEKAKEFEEKKNNDNSTMEDYVDSLIVGLKVTEDYIKNLTIRKFWRYIKRLNKHEQYQTLSNAKYSGFVTFKDELSHWMTSIEVDDKYKNYKTDEEELRNKVG